MPSSRGSSQPRIEPRSPTLQVDILYHLSHQESPRIQEWVAYLTQHLSDPGIELGSPAMQVDSLPAELPGKPYCRLIGCSINLIF